MAKSGAKKEPVAGLVDHEADAIATMLGVFKTSKTCVALGKLDRNVLPDHGRSRPELVPMLREVEAVAEKHAQQAVAKETVS
jgi:hypothetical protein